jgi:osmoprotectant transport system permease protein
MGFLVDLVRWFTDPGNWSGAQGIPARLTEHLWYSVAATLVAIAIALPIGLWVGHTGRGETLAINIANVGRAVPTFGVIILVVVLAGSPGFGPVLIALVAFAVPPILTNTTTGIRGVDPGVRQAAAGMGMRGPQMLWHVEIPVAMPLIMAGVRTSAVQVVATATLAAFVGLGGFGRYIIDGLSLQNYAQVLGGAALVAALALGVEALLGVLQRAVTSEGVRQRNAEAAAEAKITSTAA